MYGLAARVEYSKIPELQVVVNIQRIRPCEGNLNLRLNRFTLMVSHTRSTGTIECQESFKRQRITSGGIHYFVSLLIAGLRFKKSENEPRSLRFFDREIVNEDFTQSRA